MEIWQDAKFRGLSRPPPSAQVLWLYLLTGKHTTALPGMVLATPKEIFASLGWPTHHKLAGEEFSAAWEVASYQANEVGWSLGRLSGAQALEEIVNAGMAQVDADAGLIWLPNALKRNGPQSVNNVVAWRKAFTKAPECPLLEAIDEAVVSYLSTKKQGSWLKAWKDGTSVGGLTGLSRGSGGGSRHSVSSKAVSSEHPSGVTVPLTGDTSSSIDDVGDPFAPPQPAKKQRAKRVPATDYAKFIDGFQALFVEARGVKPTWGEKQGSWAKQLLRKEGGLADALARAQRMFDMARKGWPEAPDLGILVSCWDKFAPAVVAGGNHRAVVHEGPAVSAEVEL
jgi:hypothetical protein